jgi:pseudaminic acid synthase
MSTLVVAEISANHNGKLEYAIELVREAKLAGADAVKFQTYQADTIAADGAPEYCLLKDGPWAGQTLRQLYQDAYTPRAWHHDLFMEARKLGLQVFSTPFCPDDVDFLETLDCARYKVSSFDIVNIPLLERINRTKKPAILSTGMATNDEIATAVEAFGHNRPLTLLHCISQYPAETRHMNLARVTELKVLFGDIYTDIGLSDHSFSSTAVTLAVGLGAKVIEKHLCLRRELGGPDAGFSLEPDEFRQMVKAVREAERAMESRPLDQGNILFRPSLWLVRDIGIGEILTGDHVAVLRPGTGLPPSSLAEYIGRQSCGVYRAQQPLREGMFPCG